MAYERLLPNSLTGAWSGAVGDIDEGVENDDGTLITPSAKGDVAVVGFENVSTLVDADTVIDVRLVTRHNKSATASGADSLLYDNMPAPFTGYSWDNPDPLSTQEFTRCDFSGPNKGIDATAAQINALTVDITANQTGMPSALGHQVDCLELRIEYIKATRVFGDLVQKADSRGTDASSSITQSFTQANAGNVLLAFWTRNFSAEPSVPSGWTKVEYWTGAANKCFCIYKIADGTETSVTISSTTTNQLHTCRVMEIEWNGTAPSIQKSSATLKTMSGTQDTTPALTPTISGAGRNVYIGVCKGNLPGSMQHSAMVGETAEEYFCLYDSTATLEGITTYHHMGASGSTSVTVDHVASQHSFALVLNQDKFALSAEAGSFTIKGDDYHEPATSPTPSTPFVWGETDIWHDHSQVDIFANHANCGQITPPNVDWDSFNYYNIIDGDVASNLLLTSKQIQPGDLLLAITDGSYTNSGWKSTGQTQNGNLVLWKIAEGNEFEDDVTQQNSSGIYNVNHIWVLRNPFLRRTGNPWLDLVDSNSTAYTAVTTGTPGSVTPRGTDDNLTISVLATNESSSQGTATIDSSYTVEPTGYGQGGNSYRAASRLDISGATNPSWTWNNAVGVALYSLTFAPAKGIVAEAGSFTVTGFDATLTHNQGGGNITLTAEAGSYSWSGVAANLEIGYALVADSGSFSINGVASTLLWDHVIPADIGAFTVTGVAANLEHHQTLSAAAGSFSFTGFDATLNRGKTLIAEIGAFTVTGVAASLEIAFRIIAESGAISVAGQDANLEVGSRLAADAGNISITGFDATLDWDQDVLAEAGSFTVTGVAANLEHSRLLTADAGSFTITGFDATLRRSIPINAESGTFTITGSAATLLHGWNIAANAGSFDVTGLAASLVFNRRLAADAGSFSVNGVAANLEFGRTVIAETGGYSFTGFDATLTKTGNVVLIAEAGNYTVTGVAANLEHAYVLAADVGAFTVTGFDALLDWDQDVLAEAGSFSITGVAANLEIGYAVIAETGVYTVTGFDANLIEGGSIVLTANAGAFTVTGFDASLETGYAVIADAGSFAISGIAANLEWSRLIAADAGSFAINGFDANIEHHRILTANAGAFTVTGFDATLVVTGNIVLAADAGSYAVTGVAASLELGRLIEALAGSYALTGFDAVLDWDQDVLAETGAFTVTGIAASLEVDHRLSAEPGAYTITGIDAGLDLGFTLNAEQGSVAVTGQAAGLLYHALLTAEAGGIAFTGFDATLSKTKIINAEAGTYALAGFDATLIQQKAIISETGSYLFFGAAANLVYSEATFTIPPGRTIIAQPVPRADIVANTLASARNIDAEKP